MRATDRAGNATVLPFQFTIDEIAPTGLVPVTFNHAEGSHFDAITDLEISWAPPIDVSGLITTFLTVDQITDTIPLDEVSGLTAVHSLDNSGDWYAHLAAMDAAGNIQLLHFGPWHVGLNEGLAFGAQQQSILIDGYVDVANNEWRLDREYLDDDERTYGSEVTFSPGGQQSFLTAWDASRYFMAWRGGQWTLDGELWIYLKAGGSGSNRLIVTPGFRARRHAPLRGGLRHPNHRPALRHTVRIQRRLATLGRRLGLCPGRHRRHGNSPTAVWHQQCRTARLWFGRRWQHLGHLPRHQSAEPRQRLSRTPGRFGRCVWGRRWLAVVPVGGCNGRYQRRRKPTLAVALTVDLAGPQAPNNPWGPGSTLEYVITVNNLEDTEISDQPLSLMATLGTALVHDGIEGATCTTTNPWACTLDPLAPGLNTITLTTHLAADLSALETVTLVATLTDSRIPPELNTQDSLIHQLDGAPPVVELYAAPFVGLGSYSFSGSASDGDGAGVAYVEVRPQFGSWQRAEGTTLWTVDLTISPFAEHGDSWQFEVRAVDLYGQASDPVTAVFTVDLEGPEVTFDSPTQLSGSMNDIMGSILDVPDGSAAATVLVQLDDAPWREATLFALDETTGSQPFLWTLEHAHGRWRHPHPARANHRPGGQRRQPVARANGLGRQRRPGHHRHRGADGSGGAASLPRCANRRPGAGLVPSRTVRP